MLASDDNSFLSEQNEIENETRASIFILNGIYLQQIAIIHNLHSHNLRCSFAVYNHVNFFVLFDCP